MAADQYENRRHFHNNGIFRIIKLQQHPVMESH